MLFLLCRVLEGAIFEWKSWCIDIIFRKYLPLQWKSWCSPELLSFLRGESDTDTDT
jgi:hypothetical protein